MILRKKNGEKFIEIWIPFLQKEFKRINRIARRVKTKVSGTIRTKDFNVTGVRREQETYKYIKITAALWTHHKAKLPYISKLVDT